MTGADESWLRDGLDDIADAESGLWVRGIDYIAGWCEARAVADRLNRALMGAGFELSAVRAVASTDSTGRGVVRMAGRLGDVERLAGLLEAASDPDGGAL